MHPLYILLGLLVLSASTLANINPGAIKASVETLDSSVEQLEWMGIDKKVVILRTQDGHIYRSDDIGATWADLLPTLQSEAAVVGEGDNVAMDIIVGDSERMIILSGTEDSPQRSMWISHDAGATWQYVQLDLDIHQLSLKFSPLNNNYVAALVDTPECIAGPASACHRSLITSVDGGIKWTGVDGAAVTLPYVSEFSWSRDGTGIWAIETEGKIPTGKPDSYDPEKRAVFSQDFFKTNKHTIATANKIFVPSPSRFIIIAKWNGEKVTLAVSNDEGETFNDVKFGDAAVSLFPAQFEVLDASEDVIFLYVAELGQEYGTLYVSDFTGLEFVASMERLHNAGLITRGDVADFYRVEGLFGIYVANQVTPGGDDRVSRITFNKGGHWEPIPYPSTAHVPDVCNKPDSHCSLHVYMWHDWHASKIAPIYSSGSALGVIIGTGNIGLTLDTDAAKSQVYLSRDAGRSWNGAGPEEFSGLGVYEYGDHGGITVLASSSDTQGSVMFSGNEGVTWEQFPFYNASSEYGHVSVQVENIQTEPSTTGLVFLMYGYDQDNAKDLMINLDFSNVFDHDCGPDDYVVDGDVGGTCLLGKKWLVTRRKQMSLCLNKRLWDRDVSSDTCACTADDWECDIGYVLKANKCVWNGKPADEPGKTRPIECEKQAVVPITQGYRRVTGDACVGGVDLGPIDYNCNKGMSAAGVIVILLLVLVACAVAALAMYKTNLKFKLWVDARIPESMRLALAGIHYGRVDEKPQRRAKKEEAHVQVDDLRIPDLEEGGPIDVDGQEAGLLSRVLAAHQEAVVVENSQEAPFTVDLDQPDESSDDESDRIEQPGRGAGLGQTLPSPFSYGGSKPTTLGEFEDFDAQGPL